MYKDSSIELFSLERWTNSYKVEENDEMQWRARSCRWMLERNRDFETEAVI